MARDSNRIDLLLGDCVEVMAHLEPESFDAVVCDPPYNIGLHGLQWDKPSELDPSFGYWIAGFVDGEGHFAIAKNESTFQCSFRISIRRDDKDILLRIRDFWDEGIVRDTDRNNQSKPQSNLSVSSKEGCLKLVRFFDSFQLRAKKLNDYTIWRDAVLEWNSKEKGHRYTGKSDWSKMAGLKEQSHNVRVYRDPYWSRNPFQNWTRRWAEQAYELLKPGSFLIAFGSPRTYHRLVSGVEDAGFEIRDTLAWLHSQGVPKSLDLGDGRGTNLKPAQEMILLARKPLISTTVSNVTSYGTGALNIDLCRIGGDDGRHPANLLISHDESCLLVGERTVQGRSMNRYDDGFKVFGGGAGHPHKSFVMPDETVDVWDCVDGCAVKEINGQASQDVARFFHVSKTSVAEKTAGLADGHRPHPSTKPLQLMRFLCRLVTPPGGRVLDCFLGSGSTGIAALLEGLSFIGIEREQNYMEIAQSRLAFWEEYGERGVEIVAERDKKLKEAEGERQRLTDMGQLSFL